MNPLRPFALLLLCVLVVVSFASAETLAGRVTDLNGAALQDCIIVVQRWTTDERKKPVAQLPLVLRPNENGDYTATLEPGVYDLFASCPICSPQAKQIRVLQSRGETLNIKLKFGRFVKFVNVVK